MAPEDCPGAEASTLSGTPAGRSGVGYQTWCRSPWSAPSCQKRGGGGLPGLVSLCPVWAWECTWASVLRPLPPPAGTGQLCRAPFVQEEAHFAPATCVVLEHLRHYVSGCNWMSSRHTRVAHPSTPCGAPCLARDPALPQQCVWQVGWVGQRLLHDVTRALGLLSVLAGQTALSCPLACLTPWGLKS